jgi:Carboxypeptidase regulatory-like domain
MAPARFPRPLLFAIVFALEGPSAAASDQQRVAPDSTGHTKRLSVIDGIVTDSGVGPLPSAEVVVVSSAIRMRTGENGRFRIPALPRGTLILIARRIGFVPASMILRLTESDTVHVSFALKRAALEIEVITVIGERGDSLRLLEFEYRWRHGFGRYLNRREISQQRTSHTADLLSLLGMPLVVLRGDDGVKSYVGSLPQILGTPASGGDSAKAAKRAPCEPRVFLNGVALPGPVDIDDLPRPAELAGVEVYGKSPPPIPLQYGGMSACGNVSMLWTRIR